VAPEAFAQQVDVDVEHHHDEQEQHHHRPHVYQHQRDGEELRVEEEPERRGGHEREGQEERRVHRVADHDHEQRRAQQERPEDVEEEKREVHQRNAASFARASAIEASYLSPIASSMALVYTVSSRVSKWNSCMSVSTMESTGQLSSQKPQ